jgi:hypothetical protein
VRKSTTIIELNKIGKKTNYNFEIYRMIFSLFYLLVILMIKDWKKMKKITYKTVYPERI